MVGQAWRPCQFHACGGTGPVTPCRCSGCRVAYGTSPVSCWEGVAGRPALYSSTHHSCCSAHSACSQLVPPGHHGGPRLVRPSAVVSSVPGKVLHRVWRAKLQPVLRRQAAASQAGALPGVSTEALTLFAQAFCGVSRAQGRLPALLFFDLKALSRYSPDHCSLWGG